MTDKEFERFTKACTQGVFGKRGMSLAEYGAKFGLSAERVADLKRRRAAYEAKAAAVEGGAR